MLDREHARARTDYLCVCVRAERSERGDADDPGASAAQSCAEQRRAHRISVRKKERKRRFAPNMRKIKVKDAKKTRKNTHSIAILRILTTFTRIWKHFFQKGNNKKRSANVFVLLFSFNKRTKAARMERLQKTSQNGSKKRSRTSQKKHFLEFFLVFFGAFGG